MGELTTEELARLRVPLSRLPGFHSAGLPVLVMYIGGKRNAIAVHLADAATADRVARWLAEQVGLEVGCTAPGWWFDSGDEVWMLGPLAVACVREICASHALRVPRHDPTDDRRLPDGARYVDRLALALVALHVGSQR